MCVCMKQDGDFFKIFKCIYSLSGKERATLFLLFSLYPYLFTFFFHIFYCMQCYEWFKRFTEGRTSVSEDPRPGRSSTSTEDCYVDRVIEVICGSCRLTVREVGEEVGISVGSCHAILTGKLQMHRARA